jgi:DNA invertase Pin-like site-specific DNA recombinase
VTTYAYLRQSLDPTGDRLAVDRQRKAILDAGAEIDSWLVDNDASAASGKRRPEFERLLTLLTPGDFLWIVRVDRLVRRPLDLERLIVAAENVTVLSLGGKIRLDTAEGRVTARVLVAMAAMEGEVRSERHRLANRQREAAGKPLWARRPLGLDRVDGRVQLVPAEAEVIREAARLTLEGVAMREISRRLEVDVQRIRAALVRPGTYGDLARKDGTVVTPDAWPAILDRETGRRLAQVLADPRRLSHQGQAPSTLLSGIALCGRCEDGTTMKSAGPTLIRCKACRLARRVAPLDARLDDVIPDMIARHRARSTAVVDDSEARAALDEIGARRRGLASLVAQGLLSADDAAPDLRGLQAQERVLTARLEAAALARSELGQLIHANRSWATADLIQRREILRAVAVVTIMPMGRTSGRSDAARGMRVEQR